MIVKASGGEMDWRLVFHGVVTASIIGLAATTIEQGKEIAAIKASREATIKSFEERIKALEGGTVSATSKRYNSDDAARDFGRIDRRLDQIEREFHEHVAEERLKLRQMGIR